MTTRRVLLIILVLAVVGGIGFFFSQMDYTTKKPITKQSTNQEAANKTDKNSKETIHDDQTVDEQIFEQQNETHITAIGDSLTQGVGDSKKAGGYVGVLETELAQDGYDVYIDNHGKAGDRTDQLLKKLNKKEIKASINNADVILITIGANDIMKVLRDNIVDLDFEHFEREEPKYEERLHDIFTTLRNENDDAQIYLLGFYNPFEQYFDDVPELEQIVNEWNEMGKEITEGYDGVYYIPTKDIFDQATENLFYEDNFHPNDRGYELMAKRVHGRITK